MTESFIIFFKVAAAIAAVVFILLILARCGDFLLRLLFLILSAAFAAFGGVLLIGVGGGIGAIGIVLIIAGIVVFIDNLKGLPRDYKDARRNFNRLIRR